MNARAWTRRKSITSAGPAMKPPHEASDFENVPIRRSTSPATPNSSQAPVPVSPSTPTPWASSTSSRAPCSRHSATMSGSGARSPSIENTPSTTTSTPPPSSAERSSIFCQLVELVVAEGPDAGAGHHHRVEDRGVVARVADHGVAGSSSVAMQPTLAW